MSVNPRISPSRSLGFRVWREVGALAVGMCIALILYRRSTDLGPGTPTVTPFPTQTSTMALAPLTSTPSLTLSPTSSPTSSSTPSPTLSPTVDLSGRARAYLPVQRKSGPSPTPSPTRTPKATKTPTPTPTPRWPPALSEPGRSKLGVHVIRNNSPDILEFVRVVKPAVMKGVDDLKWFSEAKAESPWTVTVGRLTLESQKIEGDPVLAAQAFVAAHLEEYLNNPGVDYWEGWNEPDPGERMDWYAQFEAERARQMAAHGLRVAVGGFSAGVPEWEEFAVFLPAIEAAQRYGGILHLHEYSAPTIDYLAGVALPGHPTYPDRGALTLRYRWWYEDFLKPRGLVIPLVISEAGIDGLVNPDLEGRGWQDFTRYWAEQGLGDDGTEAFIRQLAWYDAQLQQDDYVIGFAVFTAGSPGGKWDSYEITHILTTIARYVVSQK
jgi:hypothetical protein